MPQIICENLSVGYGGSVKASGISFTVNKGDYLCVVGENGAGKSTLVKTLLGLRQPMGGKLEFSDGLVPRQIGYLPQQTAVQRDFPASVVEVVRSGLNNRAGVRPFYNPSERKLADDMMKRLGIYDIRKSCYRELSGGQQQRALLARALCAARKLLLLDEPVSGLDPHAAREFYQIIKDLNRGEGMTIIMVTHDVSMAIADATSVLHLGQRPLYFASRDEYINSNAGRLFLSPQGGTAE